MELQKLSEFFPPDKIEWRVGSTNQDKTAGIALAYVTNRAIQERLDEVCGPENWKNEFIPWKNDHQLCGISIRIDGEWITKWDGAENTQVEPLKGGLSASMKRAAAQWGIGRYLYDVENKWYPLIKKGKSYIFDKNNYPKLPEKFLPKGCKNEGYQIDLTTDEDEVILNLRNKKDNTITEEQTRILQETMTLNNIDKAKVLKWGCVAKLEDLTKEQYSHIMEIYGQNNFSIPTEVSGISEFERKRIEEINKKAGKKK